MKKRRNGPRLKKTVIARQRGYDVCTVDAFGIRSLTRGDEEFTNVAIHTDFPSLVPPHEIWIDARLFEAEGLFFLTNALVQLAQQAARTPANRAYEIGLAAERAIRARLLGQRFRAGRPHRRVPRRIYAGKYTTLPDQEGPIAVALVEGCLVRSIYKTDYTEGGHHYVYKWVPESEIWIERDMHEAELPFLIAHEYSELRLMRDEGMAYDAAHQIASKIEFALREGESIRDVLTPEGRQLTKADLPRLTSAEFFEAVLRRCKLH